uniref:Uncharacterized protein n=1 Tax=Oryza punctata TaxID=4537 RepID=A0A0E0LIE8_ORYPU
METAAKDTIGVQIHSLPVVQRKALQIHHLSPLALRFLSNGGGCKRQLERKALQIHHLSPLALRFLSNGGGCKRQLEE